MKPRRTIEKLICTGLAAVLATSIGLEPASAQVRAGQVVVLK